MDSFARNFVVSSLVYLGLMALLGFAMALNLPWSYQLRYTHMHLGLLGWMSMMIFGVGYHVLPRFAGRQLYSKKMGHAHWFLANLGLIGMAVFFPLQNNDPAFRIPFILSTALQTLSLFLFITNITLSLFGRGKKMAEKCQPTLAVELAKLRRSF